MALTHLQTIAIWKGSPIKLFINGTKKFAVQWLGIDSFAVRSKNICLNADATLATGVLAADLADLEGTDAYGAATPDSWTTPAGYVVKQNADGFTYYISEGLAASFKDTNGDGIIDSKDELVEDVVRSANFLDDPITWAKENPLYAFVGGVTVYLIAVSVFVSSSKKKAKLSLGLLR